jgi:hypothetical protein
MKLSCRYIAKHTKNIIKWLKRFWFANIEGLFKFPTESGKGKREYNINCVSVLKGGV